MSQPFYFKIFGKTHVPKLDRRLLDNTDVLPKSKEKTLKILYKNDFENAQDTIQQTAFEGKHSLALSPAMRDTMFKISLPPGTKSGWVRARAKWHCNNTQLYDLSQSHQGLLMVKNKEKGIRYQTLNIHRFLDCGKWEDFWADIKIPDTAADTIIVNFLAPVGNETSFIDNLTVEYTE